MAADEYLRHTLKDFAECRGAVRIYDILDADDHGCGYKAQEIIDECTMQAATNAGMSTPDANVELRLRELVAVLMKLQELGLLE